MITLIEALNYRSLRYIRQPISPFHVLIGPNASGKSTFLDVVSFLGRLVSDDVEAAVSDRTENFVDLLWNGEGNRFELAVEAAIPTGMGVSAGNENLTSLRYEVAIGVVPETPSEEIGIISERVFMKPESDGASGARSLFPDPPEPPKSINHIHRPGWKLVVGKKPEAKDNFVPESRHNRKRWDTAFKLGHRKSALGNLPPDESLFPATTWLQTLLVNGVQPFALNGGAIRLPSPPNRRPGFRPDGSNLPEMVFELKKHPEKYSEWIRHLRTALPDLATIHSNLRQEDRHRYLVLEYESGLRVPSWMASDGTLRMLALTIPAYLPVFQGIYLIEEPENGIHPRAVETVYQSLSSVYDAQILLASHSPVILGCATADKLLCFAKNPEGATDIVRGTDHPRLQAWKGETNIGQLFAAGVLG